MSGKLPFLKFWTQAWRSDPQLRMCSAAARGLWIDVICLMHEATPRGHLLVNGVSPTNEQLAMLVSMPADQCAAALAELIANGVCTVRKNGVVMSRKIVRDEEIARKKRENGAKGGNPALTARHGKDEEIEPSDNHKDIHEVNKVVSHRGQRTEDRVKKEESSAAVSTPRAPEPAAAAKEISEDFHSLVLAAAGVDVTKDTSGRWFNSDNRWRPTRWVHDLHLTEAEVLSELRTKSATLKKPPGSLGYFDGIMADAAARKSSPALSASSGAGTFHNARGQPVDQDAYLDRVIAEYSKP